MRADVGDEETGRHRRQRYGDSTTLQLWQRHGRLPIATPLGRPNCRHALREVASEERDILRQVEVPIHDRCSAQGHQQQPLTRDIQQA